LVTFVATDEPWVLLATAAGTSADRRAEVAERLAAVSAGRADRVLLVTCHRVELYGVGPPVQASDLCLECGDEAVRHLLRVASGLESAVVGEDEVLHQVRQTLAAAGQTRLDLRLARLFESAIAAGRAARAQLPARHDSGLAEVALAWLADRADLRLRPLLVVGAGPMGRGLAGAAASRGAEVVTASRTPGRATLDLDQAARLAPGTAAIAVALGGEWGAIGELEVDLPPVADLSAPPALPAAVRGRLGASYLGIDDLWRQGGAPSAWVGHAERCVEDGTAGYMGWLCGRESLDVLRAVRSRSEDRRRARVERLLRRLPGLSPRERELVDALTRQLVSDVLHEPVSELRSDLDGSRRAAARTLFRL
jgi:glutamyl-tRNA reductase